MWDTTPSRIPLVIDKDPHHAPSLVGVVRPTGPLRPVVVAVARDGSDAAVRRGAAEAARSGRQLHLVHVAMTDHDAEQLGREALSRATSRACDFVDDAAVKPLVVLGSAVPELAAAARGCALLVTERRAPDPRRRPSTSVTAALAAATDVPLLSVPAGWVGEVDGGVVTTGVDVAHGQHVALRSAVVAALLHHATLRVITASWRPQGSGASDLTHVAPPLTDELREQIAREVAAAGGDPCDVAVELVTGRPEVLLVGASHGSTLVVLGRHSPLLRSGSRLGPVARAVVRDAACPVLLAPPEDAHRVLGRTTT